MDLKIYQRAIQGDKFSTASASASDATLNSTATPASDSEDIAAKGVATDIPTNQQTTLHVEKLSDALNNHGQLNISPVNATLINSKVVCINNKR